jgi:hypothetical protein
MTAAALASVLVVVPAPRASATMTAGEVSGALLGELSLSPGIPVDNTCRDNTYQLTARLVIDRALSTTELVSHASLGVDQLDLTIVGTSTECTSEGSGSAFTTCSTSSTLGTDGDVPGGPNDVLEPTAATCSLTGSIARVGVLAALNLSGTVTVTDASSGAQRTFAQNLAGALAIAPSFATPCGATQCVPSAFVSGSVSGTTSATPEIDGTRASAGNAVFKGTADLDAFPCSPAPPYGTGPCHGSFSGDWAGSVAGTSGSSAYELTWSAPSSIAANFDYAEWQCLSGVETILGSATGDGSATAAPGQIQGKWQVPGESFARDIIGVSAVFHFTWTRAATSAVITFDPASMTIEVAGLGPKLLGTGPQFGPAVFAATHTDPVQGPPLCSTPLTHVQGNIAGTVSIAQVSA